MAKEKEVRSEKVGTSFTPSEMAMIDKYCEKLDMSRSEFVAAAVCVTLQSDIALKVVANLLVPTCRGVKMAINEMKLENPELSL